MDDKARIREWLHREWSGYLEECDGHSEAAEYACGDCASDLQVPERLVREVLYELDSSV